MNKILRGVDELVRLVVDKWNFRYSNTIQNRLEAARLPLYCFIKDAFHSKEAYSERDFWYPMIGVNATYMCIRLEHYKNNRRVTYLYLDFFDKDRKTYYTYNIRITRTTIDGMHITRKPYLRALHNYLRTRI